MAYKVSFFEILRLLAWKKNSTCCPPLYEDCRHRWNNKFWDIAVCQHHNQRQSILNDSILHFCLKTQVQLCKTTLTLGIICEKWYTQLKIHSKYVTWFLWKTLFIQDNFMNLLEYQSTENFYGKKGKPFVKNRFRSLTKINQK